MIRLTRRYKFAASHRLHSPALSDAANRELYGKCNNPHGHGHNYTVEVTVSGTLDSTTGQLVSVDQLDDLVRNVVTRDFDHRDMNTQIPEFQDLVPTSENVALVIQRRLESCWPGRFPGGTPRLDNVRLHETKRNRFDLIAI